MRKNGHNSSKCVHYINILNNVVKLVTQILRNGKEQVMNQDDFNILLAFGLTREQTRILFSLEFLLTNNDIVMSTMYVPKMLAKKNWLSQWQASIQELLKYDDKNALPVPLYNFEELMNAIKREKDTSINHTWYHMIILEAVAFEAYTPLGINKEDDKAFKKIHYSKQIVLLKQIVSIVSKIGIGTVDIVDRYEQAYNKALNTATGKIQKYMLRGLIVVATSAIVAATAGAAAGPIAVALMGSEFAGLSGAALVSACLAALGGGAIAVGGAGMAGGTLVIVGGGALLGAAGSGAAVVGATAIAKTNSDLAISQGAKLTVVLREIILNGQKDILCAQAVLENFKQQIGDMRKELEQMKLDKEEDKKAIQNLKCAVEALERLYKSSNVFVSSFEIGSAAGEL